MTVYTNNATTTTQLSFYAIIDKQFLIRFYFTSEKLIVNLLYLFKIRNEIYNTYLGKVGKFFRIEMK